jgi:hypothetical protein
VEKGLQVLWGFLYLRKFRRLTELNRVIPALHIFLTEALRQTCLKYLRLKSNTAWKRSQSSTARKDDVKMLNVAKMMIQIKQAMPQCN